MDLSGATAARRKRPRCVDLRMHSAVKPLVLMNNLKTISTRLLRDHGKELRRHFRAHIESKPEWTRVRGRTSPPSKLLWQGALRGNQGSSRQGHDLSGESPDMPVA